MMNFSPLLLALTTSLSSAEVLTLTTGDRFSGELLSISSEKGILLKSPRSPEPIAFRTDAFSHFEMTGPSESNPFQTERLMLTNGDILPGKLVGLNQQNLTYESLSGEELTVKRSDITTLRFGIKPQTLRYAGPAPLSQWKGTGKDRWVMSQDESEGLLMQESGEMQLDVGLKSQFLLSFQVKWQERPSLRVYFGESIDREGSSDRYYIDLNSAGVQVKREQSADPRWVTMVSLNRVEAFDDNEVEVELRVNRLIGTLDLYLDGQLIRSMTDRLPATTGTAIALSRSGSNNNASYLTNLKVYDWDAVSQIEMMEQPGEEGSDSLVDARGKRMSGTILALESPEPAAQDDETTDQARQQAPDSPQEKANETAEEHFLLQSPFAEDPIEIPASQTRIIYFENGEQSDNPSSFPKYELDLVNDGLMSAREITLEGEQITLQHPLLGELTVPRSSVLAIRYLNDLATEDS